MVAELRSEFRKLLTTRSTYLITVLVALFVALISFWPQGLLLNKDQLADPTQLANDIIGPLTVVGVMAGIVAILLMSNEYRHNTIMYTLTSTNKRLKVLAAKFIVISLYGIFFAALMGLVAPLFSIIGVHNAGHALGPQTIDYSSLVWRTLFAGWGFALMGLLLAVIIRNQIGAIVSMLVIPLVAENALFPLLKKNTDFLPFHTLSGVLLPGHISIGASAWLFVLYAAVLSLVAALLFLKRDAN